MTDNRERRSGEGGPGNLKPNVKPQYDQKAKNQQEAQEKPRKSDKPPRRSRSSDSERRGRRRERGERRERGRSEEGRRRGRDRNRDGKGQEKYPEDNLDDTECPVCFCSYDNVFKAPKLLACGHTFCLECLARINVTSAEIKTLSCPVCRELTEIRHGRDLPQLGNNEDIFRKLPPQMQKAQSVRFERSKGKLVLKKPPPGSRPSKKSLHLQGFKKQQREVQPSQDLPSGVMEEGLAAVTIINVGRPPNRVRGRMGRVFQSNHCYYALVGSIIVVTVALMIVGILSFVVMPNMTIAERPPQPGSDFHPNHTDG
ncbi:E3 ubiquitin-protein ligase RNF183 [Salminus brasiliensis]|uniref:E3 ubiquitin-protein ligase RNF183 n=1 Tax=Salminus brasiliensis TaxID=930266 RepID=UPI003B8329E2